MSKLPISICVIAKNEEKNIRRFLTAIVDKMGNYDYEIVIVDTGSNDNTVSIAQNYTDKIYHFDWVGDFSAARNFSLSCAKNDWVLVLDCDEYLTDIDTSCFEQMAIQAPEGVGVITLINYYEMNGVKSAYNESVERFFNKSRFHYEGMVHEQIRDFKRHSSFKRIELPIKADHVGYDGTPEEMKQKADRNLALLHKMLEDNPDDPYLYFQLGQTYNKIGDHEKTCFYYGKGLNYDLDPRVEYVQMMVIGFGYSLLDLGKDDEALGLEGIYDDFCTSADFVCLMGLIYLRNGLLEKAMDEFIKATNFETSRVVGANSFIPLYNLGCINEVLGNKEDAKTLYQACGDFAPAKIRLSKI